MKKQLLSAIESCNAVEDNESTCNFVVQMLLGTRNGVASTLKPLEKVSYHKKGRLWMLRISKHPTSQQKLKHIEKNRCVIDCDDLECNPSECQKLSSDSFQVSKLSKMTKVTLLTVYNFFRGCLRPLQLRWC